MGELIPFNDAERERVDRWNGAIRAMRAAKVPTSVIDAFRRYQPRPVAEHAKQWSKGDSRILCLSGESGAGKSVAAALVVARTRGYSMWFHAHDLQTINPIERERWDEVLTCKLLVIDDLGVERLTENVASVLDAVITKRFDWKRRTVITTNVAGADLVKRYGDRIARRISESGSFFEAVS